MNASIRSAVKNIIIRKIAFLLPRKTEPAKQIDIQEEVKKEIDILWSLVNSQKEDRPFDSDINCGKVVLNSFNRLKERFSDEQLEKAHTWIKHVNVALYCETPPIHGLVEYINGNNYIFLTKRLTDLKKSVYKGKDKMAIKNAEHFYDAVCHHILRNINQQDIPSLLSLGKGAQKRKDYDEAKKWYMKVVETEKPFNGLTALLACYEEETKELLSSCNKRDCSFAKVMGKVRELNEIQATVYQKWSDMMEEQIQSGNEIKEQDKKDYVSLITGYSRFERCRGNYKTALDLLKRIPDTFPDFYRVYTEEAMLYQFKPYKNSYYCLDKAIETFNKAYDSICEDKSSDTISEKSEKSILIPLANTYYKSGRYDEAKSVCDKVLLIDTKEKRAIHLKKQLALVS